MALFPELTPTLEPTASAQEKSPQAVAPADKYIWGIYLLLCLISIVELFSASSREVNASSTFGVLGPVIRHATLLGAGFGVVWFFQSRHYRVFIPFTYLFVLLSVGMMVYTMFFGEIVNGARRSITIMGFQLQPAEFIKMSAVLLLSFVMARSQQRDASGMSNRGAWIIAIAVLVFCGLLFKQGLTNTMIVLGISLSMMLIGGMRLGRILMILGAYSVCGLVYMLSLGAFGDAPQSGDTGRLSTWESRTERFLTGDTIPRYRQPITAQNRQEMYSYMAQANGGVRGVLPGNSRESARLPLAFSDFIYAIVVEDLGLIGGVCILIVYLCLLGRAAALAARCNRAYPAFLVIGMALMIVFQALAHMAIVTGVSPVSGQPLPLISKGGSSILITSMAFGIMLSVSRYATRNNRNKKNEVKDEISVLPEELRAENPTQL